MSEVIEFAKILRRRMSKAKEHVIAVVLDDTIEEFEKRPAVQCGMCGGDGQIVTRGGGRVWRSPCPECNESRGREHAGGIGTTRVGDAQATAPCPEAGSHPAPSTKCTWNDCMMSGFDREAAAQRLKALFARGSHCVVNAEQIIDAVLDVRDSRIANTSTEVETGHTESINAPSPSLDSRRADHKAALNAIGPVGCPFESCNHREKKLLECWYHEALNARELIVLLESALAAAQGESDQYRDECRVLNEELRGARESYCRMKDEKDLLEKLFTESQDNLAQVLTQRTELQAKVERLEGKAKRANKVAADAIVRSGNNLKRAKAAEATLARIREPLGQSELVELAAYLHDQYEHAAVVFGYTTRTDTRDFAADTPNGQTMIAATRALLRKFLRLRGVES